MALLDVFKADAFSMMSMLTALDKVETVPTELGDMNLFINNPVTTQVVAIEERNGTIGLVQTTQRGAPITTAAKDKRKVHNLSTVRLALGDAIQASELEFIRQFDSETQVLEAAAEVSRRLDGPNGLKARMELTREKHRLGAIKGILLDADDTTIYNYFTEFGITPPSALTITAGTFVDGALRKYIQENIIRYYRRNAKGVNVSNIQAICGPGAFDNLLENAEFRKTYENYAAAADLRESYDGRRVRFGGVVWQEYFGTDDTSTIALADEEFRLFPGGQSGTFEVAWSPGESFSHLGQRGEMEYAMVLPDTKRDQYVEVEMYSYPLYICKRPDLCVGGTITAA